MPTPPPLDRRKFFGSAAALSLSAASFTIAGCSPTQSRPESPLVCVGFEFRVTDAGTGQSIDGASVRLFDTDAPEPWRTDGHEMRTRSGEGAKLYSECFTDDGSILYLNWTFTVSAPGYQILGPVRMTDYTGTRGAEGYKRIAVVLSAIAAPDPDKIAPAPRPVHRTMP